jgi:hypothetical protein
MTRCLVVACASVAVVVGVPALRAQEPMRTEDKAAKLKEDLALQQQNLARRFSEFQQQLLRLQQRLEKSPRKEDQDKAVVLKKALEKAQDTLISTQFDSLVEFLKNQKLTKVGDIDAARDRTLKLADDLREVLALLNENSRSLQLREQRISLEKLLKQLERVIHDQKNARAINEINKDAKTAKSAQVQVTRDTQKLIEAFGPKKKGEGGEARPSKGESKDPGKGEGKKGEGKDAGKSADAKRGEGKDAGKTGEGKQGQAKAGQAKTGDAKAAKGGEAKAGDSKAGKSGDAKSGEAKNGKSGDAKQGEAKSGNDPKAGDSKPGPRIRTKEDNEKKPGEAKPAAKKDGAGDAKSGKGSEGKASASKSGGQSGESKPGEAKPGSKSSSQGQSKSDGSPQPQSPPAASKKGDDSKSPNSPPQDNQQDAAANARKRIQEGNYDQQHAESKIDKGDKPGSKKSQDDAVRKFEDAKKKLEDLLRQLREEELERLLANLEARCQKMLSMQINVQDGTIRVATDIDKNADKKATRDQEHQSLKLSDQEKDIVTEATKAMEMLEAEGSAVAFPEVFQQMREDMKNVQRRLGVADVGKVTQGTEQDIIDTLKEMIEALKKARQELEAKKGQPGSSQQPPNIDQKLLDQIAELKMIRSMQIRVNNRTQLYGREYEGEQAAVPRIRQELRQLSDRQERIFEVTNRIAKGDNH